jgi:cytochrome c biogenesis protein CcdA
MAAKKTPKRTSPPRGTSTVGASTDQPHRAGLFDIRVIIAGLLGVYGVILVLTALLGSDTNVDNASNINYIGGGLMIAVALAFVLWARIRPIVVPPDPAADDGGEEGNRGSSDER